MEVSEKVYLVKGWPWASNVYIIDENPLTLIDTSLSYKLNGLERALAEIGKGINDVGLILHTHGHVDHTGNTTFIKENSNAIVYGHKLDEIYFDGANKYNGLRKVCGALEGFASFILSFSPPLIDKYLFGGEMFDLLNGLEVIHTPGHTPGSVCYYSKKRGILFSGDTLQHRNGNVVRVHRSIYSENSKVEEESVEMLLQLCFDKLLSGHHELILSNASEKLKNSGRRI